MDPQLVNWGPADNWLHNNEIISYDQTNNSSATICTWPMINY